jgi:hypothetical protein
MSPLVQNLIHYIAPAVIAFLTFYLVDLFKGLNSWIDGLPAIAKQLLVLAISYALTQIGALLGITLPTSIAGFDSTSISALLSGLLAFALKHGQQIAATQNVTKTVASQIGVAQPPQAKK